MENGDAQHILKSNAFPEIYPHKIDPEVAAWTDCLCDDPSDCLCKASNVQHDIHGFDHAQSTAYDLQLQGVARRPRDLMSLRGLEIYSAQAAITRDRNRHWPEPTPFFREYLRHFKHDPVEWKSPKYAAYREKQTGLIEKKKPNPWPKDIEHHFQRALQLFGGCGRDKEDLGGKLSGCNEWMAWCIFVETGVELHRKKVSSHIQVLKQKLSDNDEWMRFARPSLEAAKKESNDRIARRRNGAHNASIPRAYNSTVQRPMQLVSMEDQRGLMPSNVFQGPKIHTATFTMYWLDKTHEAEHIRGQPVSRARDTSLQHVYTELQSDVPTRPQGFHDMQDWRSRFPDLQFFGENGCSVPTYLFDAGLKFKDSFSERNAVVTDLDVCLLNSDGYTDWITRTQIHEETNKMAGEGIVQRTEKKGQHTILRRINLEPKYWASLCSIVGSRLGEARRLARESGDASILESEERNVQNFLSDLYLSQQMWATCEKTQKRKCFAIFLWRFRLVGADVAATTNWRPLHFNPAQLPLQDDPSNTKMASLPAAEDTPTGEIGAANRMQLRLRDDLWDSGRCWKNDSSQLLIAEGQSFPSAESSPTTDLTTDAGSSIFSSTSTSFALSNPPSTESFSQTNTTQNSFDSYDMNGYCESFDSNQSQETATWLQPHMITTKNDGAILQIPQCSPYDAAIEQLSMPQDQYSNIFGQLLDPKSLDPLSTPHTRSEVRLPSVGQELMHSSSRTNYDEHAHQIENDHNIHIALQYQQTDEQHGTTDQHRSPPAGPQSRIPTNLLEGYILHFEQEASRQQQNLEQHCHHQQHRQIDDVSEQEDLIDPDMTAPVHRSQVLDGTLQPDADLEHDLAPTQDITPSNLSLDWQSITYSGPTLPSNGELPAYVSRYADSTAADAFQPEVQGWQFVDVGEGLRQEHKTHDEMVRAGL